MDAPWPVWVAVVVPHPTRFRHIQGNAAAFNAQKVKREGTAWPAQPGATGIIFNVAMWHLSRVPSSSHTPPMYANYSTVPMHEYLYNYGGM
jgi:hypothetical protein